MARYCEFSWPSPCGSGSISAPPVALSGFADIGRGDSAKFEANRIALSNLGRMIVAALG